MKLKNAYTLFAFYLVLTGCAALGMGPDPNSPTKFNSTDASVNQAYGQYTGVNNAAAAAKNKGYITAADASAILALTDKARPFIDSASTLENIDQAAAGDKLALANAVLAQVQAYIDARVAPKKPAPAKSPTAAQGST